MKNKLAILLSLLVIISSCVPSKLGTKESLYPEVYKKNPLTILVLPAINKTTAADAKELFTATTAECLSYTGYYIYPTELVNDILKQESGWNTETLDVNTLTKLKDYFGADAVLLVTINKWNTSYYVVGGNVKVELEYKLVSTLDGAVIWTQKISETIDTSQKSGGSGIAGMVLDLAMTAVKTASTQYVPIAVGLNNKAFKLLPFGKYHLRYRKDQTDEILNNYTVMPSNK